MLKKCCLLLGLAVFTLVLIPSILMAESKPVQLSLFTPVQIFSEDISIRGVRLNLIYGRSASVTGIDLGLVNHNTSGLSKGIQWAAVGYVEADFLGWQNCAVNVTKGNFEGFQWGIVNYANHANGFQLGIVNHAVTLKGLQIGFVNIIKQGGKFPIFPIVNWSF